MLIGNTLKCKISISHRIVFSLMSICDFFA